MGAKDRHINLLEENAQLKALLQAVLDEIERLKARKDASLLAERLWSVLSTCEQSGKNVMYFCNRAWEHFFKEVLRRCYGAADVSGCDYVTEGKGEKTVNGYEIHKIRLAGVLF